MSDFDRNVAARGIGAARAIEIDAGLRAYMIRVYNYMAAGVALTGVVAWFTFNAAVVTNAAGQITGLFAAVRKFRLTGLVWFDLDAKEPWRLEGRPAGLAAYRKAVATFP